MGSKLKPCLDGCTSYNADGKPFEEVLSTPLFIREATGKKTVCVDKCIVDDIKMLWKNNVATLGCCCGHGGRFERSVVVSAGMAEKAASLLPEGWIVQYWGLHTFGETEEAQAAKIERLEGLLEKAIGDLLDSAAIASSNGFVGIKYSFIEKAKEIRAAIKQYREEG